MMCSPTYQQVTIAAAGPQIAGGRFSAMPALTALPTPRTITDGFLRQEAHMATVVDWRSKRWIADFAI
jgi:hypothetical protein